MILTRIPPEISAGIHIAFSSGLFKNIAMCIFLEIHATLPLSITLSIFYGYLKEFIHKCFLRNSTDAPLNTLKKILLIFLKRNLSMICSEIRPQIA